MEKLEQELISSLEELRAWKSDSISDGLNTTIDKVYLLFYDYMDKLDNQLPRLVEENAGKTRCDMASRATGRGDVR